MKLYSMFDNKVNAFMRPMYFINEQQMKDTTEIYVNSEHFEGNAIDFEIFYLGTYDQSTGKHDTLDTPKHMINLRTLKTTKTKEIKND